jgi:hypothetical protein
MTADLLWAPPLGQKLRDQLPQFAVGLDASPMIAGPTCGGATVAGSGAFDGLLGIERTIPRPRELRRNATRGWSIRQIAHRSGRRVCPCAGAAGSAFDLPRVMQIGDLDPRRYAL